MLSSSISQLTRQLTQLSVKSHGLQRCQSAAMVVPRVAHCQPLQTVSSPVFTLATRGMAGGRKTIDAKNAKRLKLQARKKKNTAPMSAAKKAELEASQVKKETEQPFLQHQEWVKFQQSISVDGFQTGQVTSATVLKKSRGGKQARLRKEREMARLNEQKGSISQKLPAIRYSEEETAKLLKLAFESLPARTGKRGTRNLKRQARRWKLVRQIRAKYKRNMMAAHERRMEKRHWKREQTKEAKEAAPAMCAKDAEYQAQILRRWADTMFNDPAVAEAGK